MENCLNVFAANFFNDSEGTATDGGRVLSDFPWGEGKGGGGYSTSITRLHFYKAGDSNLECFHIDYSTYYIYLFY